MDEPVRVVDYDPGWPRRYRQERERLLRALEGFDVEVHHVGSTAVPGLAAKPVIDILVAVPRIGDWQRLVEPLAGLGYRFVDHPDNVERKFFQKGAPPEYHVHVVAQGSHELARHVAFRDALRADAALAAEYGTLKRRLARDVGHDRAAYTEAKAPFIEAALGEWERKKGEL